MEKSKRMFYSFEKTEKKASITIYGDICSWPCTSLGEVSSNNLSRRLEELNDVDTIEVNINSYGGEVAEGLAIYNALVNHPAKVITRCDGFAASISSVIFMAGDERIMNEASLLMIHMASGGCYGTAEEHRKAADSLDTISNASVIVYAAHSSFDEDTIKNMMKEEKWITPYEALECGFATGIRTVKEGLITQSARKSVFDKIIGTQQLETKATHKENKPNQNEEDIYDFFSDIIN